VGNIKKNSSENKEHPVEKDDKEKAGAREAVLDSYQFMSKNIPINIAVKTLPNEFVPIYEVSISQISRTTELILEKIRQQLINEVNLGAIEITDLKKTEEIEEKFKHTIFVLINKYFPDINQETKDFLTTYLIQKSLGLGSLEIMMNDDLLEEIVINSSSEPVWVYHKKHGWLKSNIRISD